MSKLSDRLREKYPDAGRLTPLLALAGLAAMAWAGLVGLMADFDRRMRQAEEEEEGR